MFLLLNCILKLVLVAFDSCGIVVKLLWDYCENPVGLLWLLAAHASTTRATTVAANRGASSESKRRGACRIPATIFGGFKAQLFVFRSFSLS